MRRTLLILSLTLVPAAATAQKPCTDPGSPCPDPEIGASTVRLEVTGVALNAALGGLTSGLAAVMRGEPFVHAFFPGAAGGALVYGGKRLAATRGPAAGLAGRQLAAVGGSVVRNATRGDPALSSVTLPLGPLRVDLGAGRAARARVDLAPLVVAGVFMLREDAALDPGSSLSAGALVFRTDRGQHGSHAAGVILLRGDTGLYDDPLLFSHERVHVLQYDQAQLAWGAPAEAWLLSGTAAGRRLNRWLDLGLTAGLEGLLNLAVPYDDRPWEREAYTLADLATPETDPGSGPVLLGRPHAVRVGASTLLQQPLN